jgi:hypothetical protein
MMMASEVPTHSGIRTSSGTPANRKHSKNTGTRMAPPPIPNTPARNPDSAPTTTSNSASWRSSETSSPATGIPIFLLLARNTSTFMNRASGIPATSAPGPCQCPSMQGSSQAMNIRSQPADFVVALAVSSS